MDDSTRKNLFFSFLTINKLKKTFKSIDYINCGVPGYTSFHGKILSKNLSNKFHPNIVVVCLSNNEYEHSKMTLNEIYNTKKTISFIAKPLYQSFFFQYLYDKFRKNNINKHINTPAVPLKDYLNNIREIIKNFQTSKIIILSPPRNIIFKPLSTGEFTIDKTSLVLTYKAYEFIKNNNSQSAVKLLKKAIALDKNNYIALHWLGKIYFNKGKIRKAILLLEESIAKDPYPMTIPVQYIISLENLCNQLNVTFINTNKILSNSKAKLFLDRAHPNIEGNKIIAEKLYIKIHQLLKE